MDNVLKTELDGLTIGLLTWCAVLTVLWIVTIVFMLYLWKKLSRLTRNPSELPTPPILTQTPHGNQNAPSVYSYGSPTIEPGEDLDKRGYAKHDPRPETPISPADIQPITNQPSASHNVNAANTRNASNKNDDDDIFSGIVFGEDYDAKSKKSKKSKPPTVVSGGGNNSKKQTSDVPHFFDSQLSRNNGLPPSSKAVAQSSLPNNPRAKTTTMLDNPNFHY